MCKLGGTMRDYEKLTEQDYIDAKTDEKAFEKVYMAHQKLITVCLKKIYKLDKIMEYEYEDALRDALVKAIKTFDPSKGYTFANYAITCMINQTKIYNRDKIRSDDIFDRNGTVSLEDLFQARKTEDDAPQWEEMMGDGEFEEKQFELLEEKANLFNYCELLEKTEKEVFKCLLAGGNGVFVAKLKGVTPQRASQLIIKAKIKAKDVIERAKLVHSMLERGLNATSIFKKLRFTKPEIVGFYEKVYNYLFLDGEKPKVNKIWLTNPYKVYKLNQLNNINDQNTSIIENERE